MSEKIFCAVFCKNSPLSARVIEFIKKFAIIEEKDRDFIKEDDNMAMEISNAYSSYVSNSTYATKSNNQKQTTSSNETDKTSTETQASTRKTAADELEYLSNKYSGYTFVAGVYQQGTKFGSANTTNIMIDSRFLTKMANNSELEAEYEKQISLCKDLDEQMKSSYAAQGWRCECGTIIDKDGGMSCWTIVTKDSNAKSHLQEMSENAEKIREKNADKKKKQDELEESRQTNKEEKAKLKEKFQETDKVLYVAKSEENVMDDDKATDTRKNAEREDVTVGINLDMKI